MDWGSSETTEVSGERQNLFLLGRPLKKEGDGTSGLHVSFITLSGPIAVGRIGQCCQEYVHMSAQVPSRPMSPY
jgi:hypothetical protein